MRVYSKRRLTIYVLGLALTTGAGVVTGMAIAQAGPTAAPSQPVPHKPGPRATPPAPPRQTRPNGVTPNVVPNATCGKVLTASLTLNTDLFCPNGGVGITITGNNVVLNLNGHVVFGYQTNGGSVPVGVLVRGTTDTVENGLVSEWGYGIDVIGDKAVITNVRSTYNLYNGIASFSSGAKFTNNVAASNAGYGMLTTGANNTITGNSFVSNRLDGLYAGGTGDVITSNRASGNHSNGIDDNDYGGKLTTNVANFNGSDGIYVYTFNAIDGGGNTAKGNNIALAPDEQCYGIACG